MGAPNEYYSPTSFNPAANSLIDLYTAPVGYRAVITIFFCNRAGTDTTFRCSVAPNGDADQLNHYIYYDTKIPANDSVEIRALCVKHEDKVRGLAANGNVSINILIETVEKLAIF